MHSNDHFPEEKIRYGVARRDEMLVARMALTLVRLVEAVKKSTLVHGVNAHEAFHSVKRRDLMDGRPLATLF
jgi:hypothetical protein